MSTSGVKQLMFLILSAAIVAAIPPHSQADTTITKDISKNSVWTAAKGPYVITENVVLQEGVTLKIEPGARVELAPEKMLEVRGKLTAVGTEEAPVVFTAHSEEPWGTLHFTDFSDDAIFSEDGRYIKGCILKNCIIEKGRGIFVRFGAPLIADCEVRNNFSSGIRVEFGSPRIVRNRIYGNSTAYDSASGNGGGIISYSDKNVLIADNLIYNNTSEGGRDGGGGVYAYASDGSQTVIKNNILFGNTSSQFGGGMYAYKCVVAQNTLVGNTAAKRGGGIYAVESRILDNLVQSNLAQQGAGIFAENSEIASNSIIRNVAQKAEGGAVYYFGSGEIGRNCVVANTAAGEDACGGIYVSGNPSVHGNNIFNNSGYALHVANLTGAPDVPADDNFWGARSEKEILRLIFDWFDDEAAGLAVCTPYLERLSPDAPPPPPMNLVAVARKGGVRLSWDDPQDIGFEGHRIYFGSSSGYPYDRVVQAGPEKTFTIEGLEPGTEYWFAVSGYGYIDGEDKETGLSEEVRVKFTGSDESIAAPRNISPPDAEMSVSRQTTLEASKPRASHDVVESRWQVSAFPEDFTTLTIDAVTSGDELSTLRISRESLQEGQKYFWRVAHRTATGSWSGWSKPTCFTTIVGNPSALQGPISSSVKLEKRFSPYQVTGNTLVMPKGVLQMEPGVQVRLAPDKNLMVRGKLVARGAPSEPILFTRESNAKWGRIIFADASEDASLDDAGNYRDGNVLERCLLEYGKGILVESSSPLIKDCSIAYNDGSGITVRQGGAVIQGNDIHHNAAPTNGGGIYAYTNDVIRVMSNRIHHNHADGEGGGVFAYGYMNASTIHVEDNDIFSNEATGNGGGIYLSRSSAVGNKVESNRADGEGGGIYATFGLVTANEVRDNSAARGGGIYAERNSSITRNYVASNKALSEFGGGVYINFWGMSVENEVFTNNTVTSNLATPERGNGGVFVVGYLVFERNNIYGNAGSQLYNGNESQSSPLLTTDCYWGADNEETISKQIVDGDDDPGLGKVNFESFSAKPLKFD